MKYAFLPALLWTLVMGNINLPDLQSQPAPAYQTLVTPPESLPETNLRERPGDQKSDPMPLLTPSAFIRWVKDPENALLKTQHAREVTYSATYLPTDYMVCNSLRKEAISFQEMDSLSREFSEVEYYLLRIEVPGTKSPAHYNLSSVTEYQLRISYLSFDMQNHLTLKTEDGEEVPCEFYVFERSFNMAPYHTFLIGFPKNRLVDSPTRHLIFRDHLFGLGAFSFDWDTTQFNAIPKVKLV